MKRLWRRLMCWLFASHVYRPANGIVTGGIVSLLNGLSCVYCGKAFTDSYNDGEVPR